MRKLVAAALLAAAVLVGAVNGGAAGTAHVRGGSLAYELTNLESLGGGSSAAFSVSDQGWVAGRSNLSGNQSRHATLWRGGEFADLGTLGGPNSAVLWPVKNTRGIVSGITQTALPDPLAEKWSCGFFFPAATGTGYQCVGFRWENGVMTALPTLGGTNGFATGTNNLGETVGWAENTVHDPTCVAPQVLQFRAVEWGQGKNQLRELPPLSGDTVSAATAINDHGQIVGISGICDQAAGRFSAVHDVMWQNGKPVNIGDLGGVAWNTPMAINESGDAVGFANASAAEGGNLVPHAVLWLKGHSIQDLTPSSDVTAQATGINEQRQIVGQACDADGNNCYGFIWENGNLTNLNDVMNNGHEVIISANDIDDRGRIAGQAYDPDTGRFAAILAIPVHH